MQIVKVKTKQKYDEAFDQFSAEDIIFIEDTKLIISNGIIYSAVGNASDTYVHKIIAGTMVSINKFEGMVLGGMTEESNEDVNVYSSFLSQLDINEYTINNALSAGTMQEYSDEADIENIDIENSNKYTYSLVLIPLLDEYKNYYGYTGTVDEAYGTEYYLGGAYCTPIINYKNCLYRVYGVYESKKLKHQHVRCSKQTSVINQIKELTTYLQ